MSIDRMVLGASLPEVLQPTPDSPAHTALPYQLALPWHSLIYDPRTSDRVTQDIHANRASAEIFTELWGVHLRNSPAASSAPSGDSTAESATVEPAEHQLWAAASLSNGSRVFVLPHRGEAYLCAGPDSQWSPAPDELAEKLCEAVDAALEPADQRLTGMRLAVEWSLLTAQDLGEIDHNFASTTGLLTLPSQADGAARVRTQDWMDDFTRSARRELDAVTGVHRNKQFIAMEVASNGRGYVPHSEYLATVHRPLRDGVDSGLILGGAAGTGVATEFISLAALIQPELLQQVTSAAPWVAGAAAVVYGGKKAWESVAVFRERRAMRDAQRAGVTSRSAAALGLPQPEVTPVTVVGVSGTVLRSYSEPGRLPEQGKRRVPHGSYQPYEPGAPLIAPGTTRPETKRQRNARRAGS